MPSPFPANRQLRSLMSAALDLSRYVATIGTGAVTTCCIHHEQMGSRLYAALEATAGSLIVTESIVILPRGGVRRIALIPRRK